MKRGKDEEKPMGPMFPRLHVNDTEKGGPRAPPRNKMALYEQLSIPSQRLNSSSKTVPQSSSQGGACERGSLFSLQQPPSAQEQKKKHEDDDFTVPVFVQQSRISPNRTLNHQSKDNEVRSPFDSSSSRNTKKNSKDFAKSASNQLSTQIAKNPSKQMNGSSRFGHGNASNDSSRLQTNGNLQDYGNEVIRVRDNQQEVVRSPNDPNNGDAVSETSMVDSLSGLDISPDDVVGIIGQKHFWKARRAIVNQQRVFAVQVFELHRLIKVQRLIAGSPQSLVEDGSYSGKPPKVSPIEKILLKPLPTIPKRNNDTEFSAENAVGKASLSSVQNDTRTTGSGPFPGYSLPPSDPKTGSWSFDRPTGHQWLIPVMTPTEGLVYKPYPVPGFMSPVFGGRGPPAHTLAPAPASPIGHNFVNYGALSPPSHSYFPPYTTSPNPSSGAVETNPSGQQAVPSSGAEETNPSCQQAVQNELTLFPTSPAGQVIRVVPHNAESATESVARIFRSIQEERKHHEPV